MPSPTPMSAAPLRPRDLVDFSPVLEGIRYVRNHRTLLPTVFAKAGELMIGPSWVIFTVMGAREFAVHWRSIDAAARSDARHEHPARWTRPGCARRPARLGALGGPQRPPAAARNSLWLSHHFAVGYGSRSDAAARCGWPRLRHAGPRGRIDRLGFLDHACFSFIRKTVSAGACSPPISASAASLLPLPPTSRDISSMRDFLLA